MSLWILPGDHLGVVYSVNSRRLFLAARLVSSSFAASCGDITQLCIAQLACITLDAHVHFSDIAPICRPAVLEPEDPGRSVWRVELAYVSLDYLSRHNTDVYLIVLIAVRPSVKASLNAFVCNFLANF